MAKWENTLNFSADVTTRQKHYLKTLDALITGKLHRKSYTTGIRHRQNLPDSLPHTLPPAGEDVKR